MCSSDLPQAPWIALLVNASAASLGVLQTVRRAARLPPAEAMRPEPPANYRPALVERTGIAQWLSHTFRIAVRNLERKPAQALFTIAGLALATGILIVPNSFHDSVDWLLGFEWDIMQRQDITIGLIEPASDSVRHPLAQLPGVLSMESLRTAPARLTFHQRHRQLAIQGLAPDNQHTRAIDARYRQIPLPPDGLVISAKLAEVLGARVGDTLGVEFLEGDRKSTRLNSSH